MSQENQNPTQKNNTKARGFAITTCVFAVISIILGFFPYANLAGSVLGILSLIFAIIVFCLNLKRVERLSKIALLLAAIGLALPIATQFIYHTTPNDVKNQIDTKQRQALYENSDLTTSYNSYADVYDDTVKKANEQVKKSNPELAKAANPDFSDAQSDKIIDTELDKLEKIFNDGSKNMDKVLYKHTVHNKDNSVSDLMDAYEDKHVYASDARKVDPDEYKEYQKWENKLENYSDVAYNKTK